MGNAADLFTYKMSKWSFLLAIILLGAVVVGASSVKEKRNSNVVVNPKELGFYPSGSEETREIHGRELYTQDYVMFTTCSAGLSAPKSAEYDGVVVKLWLTPAIYALILPTAPSNHVTSL